MPVSRIGQRRAMEAENGGEGDIMDSPHLRGQMNHFRELMKAGVFSDEQLDSMTRIIGAIMSPNADATHREKLSAYKTLVYRARVENEVNTEKQETHNHLHVGMSWDQLFADSAKGYSDRERIQDEINQAGETDSESS